VQHKQQPGASCNSPTHEAFKAVSSIKVGSPWNVGNSSSKSAAASPRAADSPQIISKQSKSAAASPRAAGQNSQTTVRPPWSSSSRPSSSSNKHKLAQGSSSSTNSPTTAAAAAACSNTASTSRVGSPTQKSSPSRHKAAASSSCKSSAGATSQSPAPLEAAVRPVDAGSKAASKRGAAISGKPLSVFIEYAEAPGELRDGFEHVDFWKCKSGRLSQCELQHT
jgi:hypothetical protein